MGFLENKTGIIFGVANERSIAWSIAKAWHQAGARLAFAYQGDRIKDKVTSLAGSLDKDSPVIKCDVSSDEDIANAFKTVDQWRGGLDLMLHSVAFAPREALENPFVQTTRRAFNAALEISAFSLVALASQAAPLMNNGGSIITLSYYGAEKVIPNYNVMGVAKSALESSVRYLAYDLGPNNIRVNCISAGPVNTLAARGIAGFTKMLNTHERISPLQRNVTLEEIGAAGLFLASDAASAVTGQVLHVDCGYSVMGTGPD
ncbi:MAG: enoyl-ACP reductase [Verrucomicrobia bacterium]|nr:enoyl-ACP reductase [Verrucomicrobiota bacterium]